MSSKKMIKLKSSDGDTFEVEESVAMESQTIRHMIEVGCADSVIPLPNVTSNILAKVIEYCRRHVQAKADADAFEIFFDEELDKFDTEFVRVDLGTLNHLILAADYLDIEGLLDHTCRTVAGMIEGKTPEQIRKLFDIKNDFTPEEEEEVRKEAPWAFE